MTSKWDRLNPLFLFLSKKSHCQPDFFYDFCAIAKQFGEYFLKNKQLDKLSPPPDKRFNFWRRQAGGIFSRSADWGKQSERRKKRRFFPDGKIKFYYFCKEK